MNQSKLFTLKKNQSHDIQWCNRDINNYFYEGKKNFVRLILSSKKASKDIWMMENILKCFRVYI